MRWLWIWKDTALGPMGVPMEQPAFLAPEGEGDAGDEEAQAPEAETPRWVTPGFYGDGPRRRPRRPRGKPRRDDVAIIAATYAFMKMEGL